MRNAGLVFMTATFYHNRLKEASEENIFLSHPPSLVPSRSNKKVPFYFLGEALFGAISLANPFWVDVHPT
jgi:hypothetical protein